MRYLAGSLLGYLLADNFCGLMAFCGRSAELEGESKDSEEVFLLVLGWVGLV